MVEIKIFSIKATDMPAHRKFLARSGIYQIVNRANGKMYVGSAIHLYRRWHLHLTQLRAGKHCNTLLQRAWSKYGESAFDLEILTFVQESTDLIQAEQEFIDRLQATNPKIGYNLCPIAGSSLGYKQSPATCQKFSEVGKKCWENRSEAKRASIRKNQSEASKGKAKSPEHVKRMADSKRKIPLEDAEKIIALYKSGESQARIGQRYGVTQGAIRGFLIKHEVDCISISMQKGMLPTRKLSDSDIEDAFKEYIKGATSTVLGHRYGVHPSSILGAFKRKKLDVSTRPSRRLFTDQDVLAMLEDYKNGLSFPKLAAKFSSSSTNIRCHFVRMGLDYMEFKYMGLVKYHERSRRRLTSKPALL